MAILHVRGVPDELYEQLRRLAQHRQRSLAAEVINLLTQAVEAENRRQEQASILDSIRRRRFVPPTNLDSLTLLREDRDR
jgi:plasmid stability protein